MRYAKGAAGVGTFFAKHLGDQLAGTVGHQVLFGEFGDGVDQGHQLDDARDAVQVAHGGVERAHEINGDGAGGALAFFSKDVFAELPHPRLAVFFGDVSRQEHKLAGLHKRYVGGSRC